MPTVPIQVMEACRFVRGAETKSHSERDVAPFVQDTVTRVVVGSDVLGYG